MKKPLLLIGIAAWTLVLVIVVAIVAVNIREGGRPWNNNAALLKEEQVELVSGASLTVRADAMDIELLAGDGKQLCIRQYGVDDSSLFTTRANDGNVTVEARQRLRIGFSLPRQERLEIEIPASWLGDVTATVSSGRLRLCDAFTWQEVSLTSSSGSIAIERDLTAANLNIGSNSGSTRVQGELNIAGKCSVAANSGSIHLDKALYAQELFGHGDSGSISFATATVERFELLSTSGSIKAAGLSGSGSVKISSGSMDLDLLEPLGNISLRASSGRINVTVPPELAFSFEGRCSSGSIRTDFPVDKLDKGKYVRASVGVNPLVIIEAEVNSGSIDISR